MVDIDSSQLDQDPEAHRHSLSYRAGTAVAHLVNVASDLADRVEFAVENSEHPKRNAALIVAGAVASFFVFKDPTGI